jgi:hypothetical protein
LRYIALLGAGPDNPQAICPRPQLLLRYWRVPGNTGQAVGQRAALRIDSASHCRHGQLMLRPPNLDARGGSRDSHAGQHAGLGRRAWVTCRSRCAVFDAFSEVVERQRVIDAEDDDRPRKLHSAIDFPA